MTIASIGRRRRAVRAALLAIAIAAAIAIGIWGYRSPSLLIDLARLPFCA